MGRVCVATHRHVAVMACLESGGADSTLKVDGQREGRVWRGGGGGSNWAARTMACPPSVTCPLRVRLLPLLRLPLPPFSAGEAHHRVWALQLRSGQGGADAALQDGRYAPLPARPPARRGSAAALSPARVCLLGRPVCPLCQWYQWRQAARPPGFSIMTAFHLNPSLLFTCPHFLSLPPHPQVHRPGEPVDQRHPTRTGLTLTLALPLLSTLCLQAW